MKRLVSVMLVLLTFLSLFGCKQNVISPNPPQTEDSQTTLPPVTLPKDTTVTTTEPLPPIDDDTDRSVMSELYGSFLTMRMSGSVNDSFDGQYIRVFTEYSEIDSYFTQSDSYFFYGTKFISSLASFDDEYMKTHDVMIVKLNEPSSYISHQNPHIRIEDGIVYIGIERHIPANAPKSDTQYHLILIAPKGSFSGLTEREQVINVTEVIDSNKNSANDAERYLYLYPDYVPFVYRTDAVGTPSTVIDAISSFEELIAFYERYKESHDLSELKKHIGTLYDESVFNDYSLLAIMLPSSAGSPPSVSELFVYNLEIFITVDSTAPAVVSETTPCHLLITAVSKSDLQYVDLSMFNISFE